MRTLSKIQTTLVAMIIMVILPFTGYAGEGKIQIGQTAATTFPITISQSGSYILTSNLTVATDVDCIVIAADNVTLDLNGFALVGPGSGTGTGYGIRALDRNNITVQNGTVRDFGGLGISIDTTLHGGVKNNRLNDLKAFSNGYAGIQGDGATITNCSASMNSTGISGSQGTIINCTANYNSSYGFNIYYSTLTNCTAIGNSDGMSGNENSLINCTASENSDDGFYGFYLSITNCTAKDNDADGFNILHSTTTNCTAYSNGTNGFKVEHSTLTNCTASYNSIFGFEVSSSIVTNCTAYGNDDTGIFPTESRIEGNNVRNNGAYGINAYNASSNNYIIKNSASGNPTNNFRNGGTNNYMPICGVSTSDNCNYSF